LIQKDNKQLRKYLIQVTLQRVNEEEEEVEKTYNPCKSMRFRKVNKKRMISVWFSESNKKISKPQATVISALRLPAFKISDPVKTNRDREFLPKLFTYW